MNADERLARRPAHPPRRRVAPIRNVVAVGRSRGPTDRLWPLAITLAMAVLVAAPATPVLGHPMGQRLSSALPAVELRRPSFSGSLHGSAAPGECGEKLAGRACLTALSATGAAAPLAWHLASEAPLPTAPPVGFRGQSQVMAYDPVGNYTVLVGQNETWLFQNASWRVTDPSMEPPSFPGAVLTYDSADHYILDFAGNQTWKYTGGNWSRISTTVSPPFRSFPSMVYDGADGYVVLFGGLSNATAPLGNGTVQLALNDTWEYLGGVWTNVTQSAGGAPSPRSIAAMDFDSSAQTVVLFGGAAPPSLSDPTGAGEYLGDTWEFKNGTWNQLHPTTSPGPRWPQLFVYDSLDGYSLLFGGGSPQWNRSLDDTWTFANGNWTQLHPRVAPTDEWTPMFGYDGADGWVLLLGGYTTNGSMTTGTSNQSWEFSGGNWTALPPLQDGFTSVYPGFRDFAVMAYDPQLAGDVLFGGSYRQAGPLNDTWLLTNGTWKLQRPTTSPSSRDGQVMAYDPALGGLVLFGGFTLANTSRVWQNTTEVSVNDTWEFVNGSWARLHPLRSPPPRLWAALTYDASLGGLVLFGGREPRNSNQTEYVSVNDSWVFRNGTWNPLSVVGAPSPRYNSLTSYDPNAGDLLLYGGANQSGSGITGASTPSNESWVLNSTTWSQISAASGPPGCLAGAAAIGYDPSLNATVLAGCGPFANNTSATWLWKNATWTRLNLTGGPDGSSPGSLAFDPSVGGMVLYGYYSEFPFRATTWVLNGSLPTPSLGAAPLTVSASGRADNPGSSFAATFDLSVVGGTAPLQVQWNFGDGTWGASLSQATVRHTYPGAGSYRPSVVVADGSGHHVVFRLAPVTLPVVPTGGATTPVVSLEATAIAGGIVSTLAASVVLAVFFYHRRADHRRALELRRELERMEELELGR